MHRLLVFNLLTFLADFFVSRRFSVSRRCRRFPQIILSIIFKKNLRKSATSAGDKKTAGGKKPAGGAPAYR